MKNALLNLLRKMRNVGIDPMRTRSFLSGYPAYLRERALFVKQMGGNTDFEMGKDSPVLTDRGSESGTMSGHYFHQDLLVAQKIFRNNPKRHIDIGSRTDGFVAHVAVFREIEIFDIRPQTSKVKNIKFTQADLMNLPADMLACCDSVSSLHAIEHFGLGRYGDPIDFFGHEKAIDNIARMLQKDGLFYFSAPMGKQRVEFNEQRVFSAGWLFKKFHPQFEVVSFSFVDDKGDLHENVPVNEQQIEINFGCQYGCCIFELKKR